MKDWIMLSYQEHHSLSSDICQGEIVTQKILLFANYRQKTKYS